MTLCGVHDNMHVHTTVAHTCDYPLYLYRHTTISTILYGTLQYEVQLQKLVTYRTQDYSQHIFCNNSSSSDFDNSLFRTPYPVPWVIHTYLCWVYYTCGAYIRSMWFEWIILLYTCTYKEKKMCVLRYVYINVHVNTLFIEKA